MVGARRCGGFTLAELLVATAVTVVALGLAAALLRPASIAFQSLPEAVDATQRLRVAAQLIVDEVARAGAGPVLGWAAHATPHWPAVLPCRSTGAPLAALPEGCARDDALTVTGMPLAAPQAILAEAMAAPDGAIRVSTVSACELSQPACRFHAGARVLLSDGTAAWDIVPATAVSIDGLAIEHAGSPLPRMYPAGSLVSEVQTSAYSLRVDPVSRIAQLRRSTNGSADMPVLEHVTLVRFEYFGAPEPPLVIDDTDAARRRASYGPLPPPGLVDDALDAWPAGENCVFSRAGGAPLPRLAPLAAEVAGFARLPLATLADGPWCPDEAAPNRYDADLLRIRLVRITLRVQAQSPAVRGADVALFAQPGAAREAARLVPDLEVRIDAALRNR